MIVNQSNLGKSCGLYLFFSSLTYTGSLIFIEPGTIRRADVSPPKSDISRYARYIFLCISTISIAFCYATQ